MLLVSRVIQRRLPQAVQPRPRTRYFTSKPDPPHTPNTPQPLDKAAETVYKVSSQAFDAASRASSKVLSQDAVDTISKAIPWGWVKRSLVIKSIIGVGGLVASLICADLWYANHVEKKREERVNDAFAKGSAPAPKDKIVIVPRGEELRDIKAILTTTPETELYSLITGEHGAGKTTLVIEACNQVGAGCVYVTVPNNVTKFGQALGAAINFEFDEYISFTEALRRRLLGIEMKELEHGPEPATSVDRVMPVLLKAAAKFKQDDQDKANKEDKEKKTYKGRPPVLVIDNINRLAVKAPQLLEELQDFAKDHADRSDIIVVFVSSEGIAPRFLQDRSSWSRAEAPYEIGDISESEAEKFLVARGVNEANAKKAVKEVAGGRFKLLNQVAKGFSKGKAYEVTKKEILADVRREFAKLDDALLLHCTPVELPVARKETAAVIRSIAKQHEISAAEFEKLAKSCSTELLKHNVFSYHPSSDTITLQSQAVATYVKETM